MPSKTDYKFDDLLPDTKVALKLGVTSMTIWRWDHEPQYRALQFPPAVKLGRRNYRSSAALDAWTQARALKKALESASGDKHTAKKAAGK